MTLLGHRQEFYVFLTVNRVLVLFVAKICLFYLLSPKFFYANFYSLICILFILLSCEANHGQSISPCHLDEFWIWVYLIQNYKAMKDLQSTHTLAPISSLAETLIMKNLLHYKVKLPVIRLQNSTENLFSNHTLGKFPSCFTKRPHSTVCLLS